MNAREPVDGPPAAFDMDLDWGLDWGLDEDGAGRSPKNSGKRQSGLKPRTRSRTKSNID